ncbi:MAG: NAD-dependent epimerase/dehydratase family protein [Spirochaetaceae bacterium]|nr:MAG: NAD-dependent epimerase/dehydratase family protein [Spirochaetaceae bacterium]
MGAVLITGGGGFLGARLAHWLLENRIDVPVLLTDIVENGRISGLSDRVSFIQADLGDPDACRHLVTSDVSKVIHLASLVSGGAEKDFEAGMRANLHATINLMEACRLQGKRPGFVFASSIATFGGSVLPAEVDDWTYQHPQNSYGVHKVIGEQLLNEYSRKGYLDGRATRLPAVIVRDDANSAASGYASALVREPLRGSDYVCPVRADTRIPIIGVRKCIELLWALSELEDGALGDYRTVNGPGISPSAEEISETVRRLHPQPETLGTVDFEPAESVQGMIDAWPRVMRADRALELGLPADRSIDGLIAEHLMSLMPS